MFTIVYAFSQNDQLASDDELSFTINLTNDFVDIIADTDNPIEHLPNLAVYGDDEVLNTGTDYVFGPKVNPRSGCVHSQENLAGNSGTSTKP